MLERAIVVPPFHFAAQTFTSGRKDARWCSAWRLFQGDAMIIHAVNAENYCAEAQGWRLATGCSSAPFLVVHVA